MSTILKCWREAATLMLITAKRTREKVTSISSDSVHVPKVHKGDNFDILMLKRSSKSTFMPNLYVFPGGIASDADFSKKWLDIFSQAGIEVRDNLLKFLKGNQLGAPMFNRPRDAEFSLIPSEMAFRICAIRETFEESGVLLARRASDLGRTIAFNSQCAVLGNPVTSDIAEWRQRVERDPDEFIRMCQELGLVPDVWSLYEWSNWLTPAHEQIEAAKRRRYDTAFFICIVDEKPMVVEDNRETVDSQWGSPRSFLEEFRHGTVIGAPPQLYEMSRLLHFSDADELHQSVWKSGKRARRLLPVRLQCADVLVFLYPGDDYYPSNPDVYGEHECLSTNITLEELNKKYPRKHRVYYTFNDKGVRKPHFLCNIDMEDSYLLPCLDFYTSESKL